MGRRPAVDVHWRTEPTGRNLALGFDELWARSTEVDSGGVSLRTVSPSDALLIGAAHGTRSFWWLWKWVVDVARQLHHLDPDELAACRDRAGRAGAARSLLLAEALAADLLGEPTPPLPHGLGVLHRNARRHLTSGTHGCSLTLHERQQWRRIGSDSRLAPGQAWLSPLLRRSVRLVRHT